MSAGTTMATEAAATVLALATVRLRPGLGCHFEDYLAQYFED